MPYTLEVNRFDDTENEANISVPCRENLHFVSEQLVGDNDTN